MKSNVFLFTALGLMVGLIVMGEWVNPLNAEVQLVQDEKTASRAVDVQENVKGAEKIRISSKPLRLPTYKPPKGIGAPGGRVGGGTRGNDMALAMLFAMVPDHLGLTIKEQPSLYWYLSRPAPYKMVLTVNREDLIKPVLELTLADDGIPGIHSVCLNDYNVKLELGKEYNWFVELVVDTDSPARNLVAGGRIKRVAPPETLLVQLRDAEPQDVTSIYSEAGLWYDAFDSISDLIARAPDNQDYPRGRNHLLKQIDMMEIVREEESVSWLRDSTNKMNGYAEIPYIQTVVDYQRRE